MSGISKAAQKHLLSLADKDGNIPPKRVLEDAKNPKSPLHKYIEWDDRKAAFLYRLNQARELISYCIDRTTGGREIVWVPSRETYVLTREAVKNVDVWREAVDTMKRELINTLHAHERTIMMGPKLVQKSFSKFKTETEGKIENLSKMAQAA